MSLLIKLKIKTQTVKLHLNKFAVQGLTKGVIRINVRTWQVPALNHSIQPPAVALLPRAAHGKAQHGPRV